MKLLKVKDNESYKSDVDGTTMRRENGLTPNGNQLNEKWVLRDADGKMVDFDQYRHDLAERNDIKLYDGLVY